MRAPASWVPQERVGLHAGTGGASANGKGTLASRDFSQVSSFGSGTLVSAKVFAQKGLF